MVLDYLDRIQLALDYMEQNLKADIHLKDLSVMAGYSEAYYNDLFKKVTGMPIRQYLVRRRLAHAICEISEGRRMLDIALEYGFDTYAGFYRAFCREYGCSPSNYLKGHYPARPYKISLKQEEKLCCQRKKFRDFCPTGEWNRKQSVKSIMRGAEGPVRTIFR